MEQWAGYCTTALEGDQVSVVSLDVYCICLSVTITYSKQKRYRI